jgi:DNA helicase-4
MDNLGKAAVATRLESGSIAIGYTDQIKPSLSEMVSYEQDIETIALLRIIKNCLEKDQEVVMLRRTNNDPWSISRHYSKETPLRDKDFLAFVRNQFPAEKRHTITLSTAHKYKGKESQVVIVLDAVRRKYPLIHPDWIYNEILGENIVEIKNEERRLFYVAITRAADELIFLSKTGAKSEFLLELEKSIPLRKLSWQKLAPIKPIKNDQKIIRLANCFDIKEELKPLGYQWDSSNKIWYKAYYGTRDDILRTLQELPCFGTKSANHVRVDLDDEFFQLVFRGEAIQWCKEEKQSFGNSRAKACFYNRPKVARVKL